MDISQLEVDKTYTYKATPTYDLLELHVDDVHESAKPRYDFLQKILAHKNKPFVVVSAHHRTGARGKNSSGTSYDSVVKVHFLKDGFDTELNEGLFGYDDKVFHPYEAGGRRRKTRARKTRKARKTRRHR